MNIDELTIGDAKRLAATLNGGSDQSGFGPVGQKCVVRTYASGVHFGTLQAIDGRQVKLSCARRLWKWQAESGISLSEVALHGVKHSGSKICEAVPEIYITDALELIPATDKSTGSIESAPVCQP